MKVGRRSVRCLPVPVVALLVIGQSPTAAGGEPEGAPGTPGTDEARREAARGLLTTAHLALLSLASLSVVAVARGRSTRRERYWQGAVLVLLSALIFYGVADEQHPFHWLMVVAPVLAWAPLPGRPHFGAMGRMAMAAITVTAVTHVIFFGEDRYHLFLSPLLCLLAASALRPSASVAAVGATS